MLKFSYTDYVIYEEGNEMVSMEPVEILAGSLVAKCYFYENKRFSKVETIEFVLKEDADKNEQFFEFKGNSIYATAYYNPTATMYVDL